MALQAGFSVERLQRFGAEAVRKEVTLACEYLGVSTGEDCFDAALDAQARSHVGFGWRVTAGAFEHVRSVTVRCNNLAARGVPFPQGWRVALQSLDLDEIAYNTAKRVAAQSGTPGIRCEMLGGPLRVQISEAPNSQGSIVFLNGFEHVLCLHYSIYAS